MMAIAAAVQILLPHRMDIYEVCILWLSAAAAVWLGWFYQIEPPISPQPNQPKNLHPNPNHEHPRHL